MIPRDPEELPPLPLNEERILKALAAGEVEYILIGGGALLVSGIGSRQTYDLDLVPHGVTDNLDRLGQVLMELDARIVTLWDAEHGELHAEAAPLDAEVFNRNPTLHLVTAEGRVDVLLRAPEIQADFMELAQTADAVPYRGIDVAVASIPDLIRMKEAAGRPKDLEDLVGLRASLAAPEVAPRAVRPPAARRRQAVRHREDEARRRDSRRDRGIQR